MISFVRRKSGYWLRAVGLAVGFAVAVGIVSTPGSGYAAKRRPRRPAPIALRQVIIRREPVIIHAVTLAQLRAELQRARLTQTGYERQVAQQYQTIRRLQGQLDARLRELRDANAQRATQLDAQFEIILQAFGLVVFAIIGALLVALSRSDSRRAGVPGAAAARPAVDWDPLQHQLREAKSALATVETRLRRLETSISQERG